MAYHGNGCGESGDGIGGAAAQLGMSRAAASRCIKNIEELLYELLYKVTYFPAPTADDEWSELRFVGRRFVEKDRAVYTWKIDSEGEDGFTGMHVTETDVCILRPSADGLSSIAEICMRQTPMVVDTTKAGNRLAAEEFHRLLQHKVDEDERERASVVRTALLKGVLSASHEDANSL